MLWIVIGLALMVAVSWYIHDAADRARAASADGAQPTIIVSISIASRIPSIEDRRVFYAIGDDIQQRHLGTLSDVSVRNRTMYLRLATADDERALREIAGILEQRGVRDRAAVERIAK